MRAELNEALDIIDDLLLLGFHDGACTNLEDESKSCKLHLTAFNERVRRAEEFLERFPRSIREDSTL